MTEDFKKEFEAKEVAGWVFNVLMYKCVYLRILLDNSILLLMFPKVHLTWTWPYMIGYVVYAANAASLPVQIYEVKIYREQVSAGCESDQRY